ncbi:putative allantoinase 1 [Cyphellophora attinorum]|uniref:Putative allantoinase 1 n=1 Tax=Cyphellophora attinorum TaxID=1664694 RepID=A0A0N1HMF9_9EURO|nr:putative allantoinase 1 [Phialophora attinorum]KPI38456.1 putative allantoinase 1 [Phialophora attinorum]
MASTAPPTLPPTSQLPNLDATSRAQVLDLLFEPSTQLHTLSVTAIAEQHFASYADLIDFVGTQFTTLLNSNLESDQKWLIDILGAHPRLGEKKVDSAMSRAEQAAMKAAESAKGAGSGGDDAEIASKLKALNEAYEEAFPGLKYVTFVNGRPRPVVMEDMERRIARGDVRQEKVDAIQAMCGIAKDRARKLGAA